MEEIFKYYPEIDSWMTEVCEAPETDIVLNYAYNVPVYFYCDKNGIFGFVKMDKYTSAPISKSRVHVHMIETISNYWKYNKIDITNKLINLCPDCPTYQTRGESEMSNWFSYKKTTETTTPSVGEGRLVKLSAKEAREKAQRAHENNVDETLEYVYREIDSRANNGHLWLIMSYKNYTNSHCFNDVAKVLYKDGYQVHVEAEDGDFNRLTLEITWYDEEPSFSSVFGNQSKDE